MVDIIIPVYRPDNQLKDLVQQLFRQTVEPHHIYFILTMTDEKSDQNIRRYLSTVKNSTVLSVKGKDFDHGGTRAMGASVSKAEYMLFMTQDAVPCDEKLIANLLKPMRNSSVAAVYARQLAGEDTGAVENYTRIFNYPPESIIKSKRDLAEMGIKTYFCSNVCALYDKEKYEKLGGFVTKTIFNEDMIFAAKMIQSGYEIAYAADAEVFHAHRYTYWQQFTRNFDMGVSQRQYRHIFERVKSESEGFRLVKKTAKYLCKTGKIYLLPDLFLQSAFKLSGYRLGKRYDKFPGWFVRKCSMNKRYWAE